MAVDRPTFSESWYRVASLKPALRPTVQAYRQYFRGEEWHVIRDPSNNQFFRVNKAAYRFIGLLDGKKTVSQVWQYCQEQLGDDAPTQGEAIQTLGQLYGSNLLHVDLPGDAENLFFRYRQRRNREVRGYVLNILFSRIPLLDPDRMLELWMPLVGWIFTWYGFVLWLCLLAFGFSKLTGRWTELFDKASQIYDQKPENLALLYASFVMIKAVHELGHAFSCKKFGMQAHQGGEVHTIGIMFMVFMPMPYVDASSSWTLANKWQRAVVGAAGMYVELACAAIAAIIWAQSPADSIVHHIAYNVLFLASVTTVIFNSNPLLRFDGYYILSDILEIPNLGQRSNDYLFYFVKKYIWGVKRATTTVQTTREKIWLLIYCVASFAYRVSVSFSIIFFVSAQLFILGVIMAIITLVGWVVVPVGKFLSYLFTSPELARTRFQAISATVVATAIVLGFVGAYPFPDRSTAEGIVEPRRIVDINMEEPGFVVGYTPTGSHVREASDAIDVNGDRETKTASEAKTASADTKPDAGANAKVEAAEADDASSILLHATSPDLVHQRDETLAQRDEYIARYREATIKKLNESQIALGQIHALDVQLDRLNKRIALLDPKSPIDGTWVAFNIDHSIGSYYKKGDKIGTVAALNDLIVRVVTDQNLGPRIEPEIGVGEKHIKGTVEGRVKSAPDQFFKGVIERIPPAGISEIPDAALSFQAGGPLQLDEKDPKSGKATEPFFEVVVKPDLTAPNAPRLLPGQRVIIRFALTPKPLAQQWYRMLRQLMQKKFQI